MTQSHLATHVLDASAILAFLQDEIGSAMVEAVLSQAVVSSVNWSEVVQKTLAHGLPMTGLQDGLLAVGLQILPFSADDGERAAQLWSDTRQFGLSLADRACLVLAARLECPALTTDRVWAMLDIGVPIQLIR